VQHTARLRADAQRALAEDDDALRERAGDLFLQTRALITCVSPVLVDLAAQVAQNGDFEPRMSAEAFDVTHTTAFTVPGLSLRTARADRLADPAVPTSIV
jgi:methionyl-tRNA synthetase